METLRCLVCQGQSIADSDADMAGDMRALVRAADRGRREPEQIRAWLIERYGDWVSYEPPLEPVTWPLWAAPLLLLARRRLARARALPAEAGLMGWLLILGARRCVTLAALWRFVRRRDKGALQFLGAGPAARPRRLCLAGQPGLRRQRRRRRPSASSCPTAISPKLREDMLGRFDRAAAWLTIAESYPAPRRHLERRRGRSAAACAHPPEDPDLGSASATPWSSMPTA